MRYGASSWHRPYGGEEGLGFGQGDGSVSGDLEGALVWANFPRRREDGIWTPNLRGTISTRAGDEILVSVHGQSVEERGPGHRRAIPRPGRADDGSRAVALAEYMLPRRRG